MSESAPVDWGDKCPNCDGAFPFLHGPHPTWVPCGPPSGRFVADRERVERLDYLDPHRAQTDQHDRQEDE